MRKRTLNFDSRQHMNRNTFEVFHYRDTNMQKVALHHHLFYEVYYFIDGIANYNIEGRIYKLNPYDILFISPSELHHPVVDSSVPYERMVLWINKAYINSLSVPGADLTLCFDAKFTGHNNLIRPTEEQQKLISKRFKQLTGESYGRNFGNEISASAIFAQFMVELNRMFIQADTIQLPRNTASEFIIKVLNYIDTHFADPNMTVENIAESFFVSKYYLSHQFNEMIGTSPYRYVVLKRMQKASLMLSVGQSPSEVYLACGYRDYSSFYRAFKAEYGLSPSEYSRQFSL
ncbi:MAG: AraC family transcriptional regulator [Christensenellales bacterium]|jgi:AraC-like DNA-binding protein|nr:AraC family transcriptional regulator [Christensenellaceae bacterium]